MERLDVAEPYCFHPDILYWKAHYWNCYEMNHVDLLSKYISEKY